MSLSITDLLTPLTSDQLKATMYSTLASLGFSVTSWRPGGIARTLVDLFARTAAPFTQTMSKIAGAGFLDFSTGPYLEVLAKQQFNVDKIHATFASGFVTLVNSGGGNYPFAAFQFSVLNPTTNKLYRNSAPFTLGPGATLTIAIEAVEAGSASTSIPGAISQAASPLLGVTVSNAAAVIGSDEELDAALVTRCKAKLASLSPNGPAAAYDYVARTPALNGDPGTVTGETITRTQVVADNSHGLVTIYIASDSGAVSGPAVALVQAGILQWATPLCITPTTVSATNQTTNVTYQVWVGASQNIGTSEATTAIAAALALYFKSIPIGGLYVTPGSGFVFEESIEFLIAVTVANLGKGPPIKTEVTVPSDTSVATGVVPVFGMPTSTITQVPGL